MRAVISSEEYKRMGNEIKVRTHADCPPASTFLPRNFVLNVGAKQCRKAVTFFFLFHQLCVAAEMMRQEINEFRAAQ